MEQRPFKFNIFDLREFEKKANKRIKLVKDMVDKEGDNIYLNISGYENDENYVLYDLGEKVTGLKKSILSVTELFPGKVNEEYKMTTGHKHPEEEIYIFVTGEGDLLLNEDRYEMKEGDVMTIPANVWHRVVNNGNGPLEVLCMFEGYEGRG